ncbi:DNA-dependent metalloprotease SPRTN [Heptranchias perlo]|uniref:DNA-dependent metalloprotease SPRTN n=1 Tax=Heptranchias perlo TaxID=212740 RepID=UPI00355A371E
MEGDLLLAMQLQAAWESEVDAAGALALECPRPADHPAMPLSVVDESWELIDPNPDLRALFLQFNDMYFWGRLAGVEVRWSPRMTLCAGVCCYEGRGGLCSIRISEPLLKLRPRRDLVETLLHEMIHALLFVTNNDKDHESHGPEFCKHMSRINRVTGAKVTIYHEFHNEVDEYRQHWWRCDGPCQNRRPYFGYVKRAMNRAPSARDPWWAEHQRTCGGTYTKVKEPENYKVKKGKRGETPGKQSKPLKDRDGSLGVDIRSVIPFSGKGRVLGGMSTDLPSQQVPIGRIPESSKLLSPPFQNVPQGHELASCPTVNSADPVPLGTGHTPSALSGWLLKRPGDHANSKVAKKSVCNAKAFVNVNGSPVKIGRAELTNTATGKVLKSSQKRPVSEPRSSVTGRSVKKKVRIEPPFPGGSILRAFGKSAQDRRAEWSTGASVSIEADSGNWQSRKGEGARPSEMGDTGTGDSSASVNCPICHFVVLASDINQHLDSCLQ